MLLKVVIVTIMAPTSFLRHCDSFCGEYCHFDLHDFCPVSKTCTSSKQSSVFLLNGEVFLLWNGRLLNAARDWHFFLC